jgi:DNA polymerase elongation subunit (family B)
MSEIYFYDLEIFKNLFTNTLIRKSDEEVFQYAFHLEGDRWDRFDEMLSHYDDSNWMVGYNSMHFDDRLIQWLDDYLGNVGKTYSRETTIGDLYQFTQDVIDNNTKRYKWGNDVDFNSIDLMRVGYLDKSLKMVAVNLEWPLIQDLPYGPDHYVQTNEVDEILDYNLNDVEITQRLYNELDRDISLRQHMSKKFGQNLMSQSNSGIANQLLNQMYAEASGQSYWDFKDQRTYRDEVNLGSVISDKISFDRDNLQKLVQKMHDTTLESDDNHKFESFEYHVRVGDTNYKIARGGIHSENDYELYEADEEYIFIENDFSSYYPYLMVNLGIKPKHLKDAFLEKFQEVVEDRLEYKYSGQKTESNALKIVINAVYGKLGSNNYWLYDPKAMYAVTINGQLFMLKMIEMMEDAGFSCVYANTDGAFFKVKRSRREEFDSITRDFEEWTEFVLDQEEFTKLLIRDVNNYILEEEGGDLKRAGALDKEGHKGSWGIMRSFDKPVVAEAIENYFFKQKPVEETIAEKDTPMDFCMAQKAGKKFDVYREYIEDGEIKREQVQRTNRYFVSDPRGDRIYKDSGSKQISMAGTSGEHVLLYNKENQYDRSRVKDRYYVKECRKIIEPFENQQQSLF